MTTVEKIHNEIDTAQDRLLQEAVTTLSKNETSEGVEDVSFRLKRLGFKRTPIVTKHDNEVKFKQDNKDLMERILYYKKEYPFLKFLTEEELDRICEKYHLIHAPVENYIKNVPLKNLKDIEQAQKLRTKDATQAYQDRFRWPVTVPSWRHPLVYDEQYLDPKPRQTHVEKDELFIAAPKSHFNLKGLENTGKFGFLRPKPKDPIVFRYVKGGVQVLTKWGNEAEDPSLINPIDN